MLSLALALLAAGPQDPPPTDPFLRLELENGVRAAILEVAEAERQSFLTFLPLGLYQDGAGRAQFAHLVEHMLIRSTDPDSLAAEGLELNGETTGTSLRLDSYAEPDHWREALARHRRWLSAVDFTEEVLAREKQRIAGELATTVPRGFTHKWAAAAWSQAAGHGLAHAAVRGDVESATVDEVAAYVRERVPVGPEVLVLAVGPVPAKEVAAALAAELGDLTPRRPAPAAKGAPRRWKAGDRSATWDLDARHYVEWYPWPGKDPLDRAAGYLLAQRLGMILWASEEPYLAGGKALAAFDLYAPAGRALTVHVALAAETDVAQVRTALRGVLDSALAGGRRIPTVEGSILQARMQMGRLPAFEFLRRQLSGRAGSQLLEAQAALNLANQEWQIGTTSPAMVTAFAGLAPERVEALARVRLSAGERASLLLEPRDSER